MQKFIDHILEHCHPKQLTYTRADAAQLIRDTGIDRATLDAQWPQIELALQKSNLIMVPALPDADEGEAVRVFRCDAPLTRVLLEVLYPTEKGDALLVETIRAITQPKGPSRPQQRPRPRPPTARPTPPAPRPGSAQRTPFATGSPGNGALPDSEPHGVGQQNSLRPTIAVTGVRAGSIAM